MFVDLILQTHKTMFTKTGYLYGNNYSFCQIKP